MTEQELTNLLTKDIVQVAVPGDIYLVTLHPALCFLEGKPQTFIGHVAAWSTNMGQWISIDPKTVVAAKPQNVDFTKSETLT